MLFLKLCYVWIKMIIGFNIFQQCFLLVLFCIVSRFEFGWCNKNEFCLGVCLVGFYGISTFFSYFMPIPVYRDTKSLRLVSRPFSFWVLLLIVHTWNSSPLWSNLLRLQCTCCTVPTISERPHGSPFVWVCQWPFSQPLSSPQLSHNDSLWA